MWTMRKTNKKLFDDENDSHPLAERTGVGREKKEIDKRQKEEERERKRVREIYTQNECIKLFVWWQTAWKVAANNINLSLWLENLKYSFTMSTVCDVVYSVCKWISSNQTTKLNNNIGMRLDGYVTEGI